MQNNRNKVASYHKFTKKETYQKKKRNSVADKTKKMSLTIIKYQQILGQVTDHNCTEKFHRKSPFCETYDGDGEGNSFSLFVSPHLSPSHDTFTGPMSFLGGGGVPVTGPRSLPRGCPIPGCWYPLCGNPQTIQDRGVPQPGLGYLKSQVRIGEGYCSQGWGTPTHQGWSSLPGIGQQMEYVIRGEGGSKPLALMKEDFLVYFWFYK